MSTPEAQKEVVGKLFGDTEYHLGKGDLGRVRMNVTLLRGYHEHFTQQQSTRFLELEALGNSDKG